MPNRALESVLGYQAASSVPWYVSLAATVPVIGPAMIGSAYAATKVQSSISKPKPKSDGEISTWVWVAMGVGALMLFGGKMLGKKR